MQEELKEAYEKIESAYRGIEAMRKGLFMTVSQRCEKFLIQNCHMCEREDCGANTNPQITRLKKLEALFSKAQAVELKGGGGFIAILAADALAALDGKEG